MIRDWETEIEERARVSRPRAKPISRRRILARVGWLDAPVAWRSGRVHWLYEGKDFVPEADDFTAAHRALNFVANRAGQKPPVDADRLRDRLHWCRRLAQLSALELDEVCVRAKLHHRPAFKRLTEYLLLESLSNSALPHSPAKILFDSWPESEAPLRQLLCELELPQVTRNLAQLIISAASGKPEARCRAMRFGATHGFPSRPVLAAKLLLQLEADEVAEFLQLAQAAEGIWLKPVDVETALNKGIAARAIFDLLRFGTSVEYPTPELSLRVLEPNGLSDGMAASMCRHWQQYRDLQRHWLRKTFRHALRVGVPETAPLLWEIVAATIGDITAKSPTLRLDLKGRLQLVDHDCYIRPTLALNRRLFCGLHRALASSDPCRALELMLQAAREASRESKPAKGLLMRPSPWFNDWSCSLRDRTGALIYVRFTGEKIGWELARQFQQLGLLKSKHLVTHGDVATSWYRTLLHWRDWLGGQSGRELANQWIYCSYDWKDPEAIFKALKPIRLALRALPESKRALWMTGVLLALRELGWDARENLEALSTCFLHLHEYLPEAPIAVITVALKAAFVLLRYQPEADAQRDENLTRIVRLIASKKPEDAYDWDKPLRREIKLLSATFYPGGNWPPHLLDRLWSTIENLRNGTDAFDAAMRKCATLPQLSRALSANLDRQPERCVRALIQLGRVMQFGTETVHYFEALRASRWTPISPQGEWVELLRLDTALLAPVQQYRSLLGALCQPDELPHKVRHLLAWPVKMRHEVHWLQQQVDEGRADMAPRLEGLKNRLAAPASLRVTMAQEVAEALQAANAELSLRLLEQTAENCFRGRLHKLCGRPMDDIVLDEPLYNAAELSMDLYCNRKWLRRLIRAHLEGDFGWRERIQANQKFLADLEARGIQPAVWLGTHRREFPAGTDKTLVLTLCNEPLEILRMGNYFETCLSTGGINAFSTVANALELNKRVIYARDETGRVVGRQLLALNEKWELVGFHIYSDLAEARLEVLEQAFGQYVQEFATVCSLPFGNEGTVPLLFVEDWYDDGIREWPGVPSSSEESEPVDHVDPRNHSP